MRLLDASLTRAARRLGFWPQPRDAVSVSDIPQTKPSLAWQATFKLAAPQLALPPSPSHHLPHHFASMSLLLATAALLVTNVLAAPQAGSDDLSILHRRSEIEQSCISRYNRSRPDPLPEGGYFNPNNETGGSMLTVSVVLCGVAFLHVVCW